MLYVFFSLFVIFLTSCASRVDSVPGVAEYREHLLPSCYFKAADGYWKLREKTPKSSDVGESILSALDDAKIYLKKTRTLDST